jgi:hypothetical protein
MEGFGAMMGPSIPDVQSMSDFEAGLLALRVIGEMYPGITFGQLPALAAQSKGSGFMGRSWLERQFSNVAGGAGTVVSGIGGVVKDTLSVTGGVAGDAIRLLTSKQVVNAASMAGAAYATDGASLSVSDIMSKVFGGGSSSAGSSVTDFFATLGANLKALMGSSGSSPVQAGMFSSTNLPWLIGGGFVLAFVFGKRGKRK